MEPDRSKLSDVEPLIDEQLVEQIKGGDRDALKQFHDRHRDLVFTVAMRVCGQELDAESVLVTVFWQIWKNPTAWNPQRGSVRTYLLLLTRSRATDLMRSESGRAKGRRKAQEELLSHQSMRQNKFDPSDQIAASGQYERLHAELFGLPEDVRVALDLAFFAGMTHVEIAEKMDLPLGTVKTRIRRGLKRLRELLVATEDDWLNE